MTNLAAPFPSLFIHNLFGAIFSKRLLLFICLLGMASTTVRAQEGTAKVTAQPPETKQARIVPPGTGTITGRVTSDDGRPLADATVALYRAFARVAGPPLMVTTDSEGRFRAANLESGLYTVGVTLPGFTLSEATLEALETPYYRIGDTVNLTFVKGGVLTGTVRDAAGEPVVAVPVRAMRVRDARGRASAGRSSFTERMTDDRGVYRIYGLPPGIYLISAGGGQRSFGNFNAYEDDAPTFFPSSTRDTAAEIPVRVGEEAANIDIRYRGERGHIISGTVSGIIATTAPIGIPITLRQASGGGHEASSFVISGTQSGFSFSGVSDGEYELMAQQWNGTGSNSAASIPRRVTVKGADVTGIELALAPLASIAGSVTLEAAPKEKCADGRSATLLETMINARRDDKNQAEDSSRAPFFSVSGGIPTEQGEFTIRNLLAGSYRLNVRLPSDAWYVRSIALPGATAPRTSTAQTKAAQTRSATASSSLITLKTGEIFANVAVQIAQDGAGLRGRVTGGTEGAEGATPLPTNLRIHLVPAERESADDTLRYSEAQMASDGAFTLANLAPGRYWMLARPVASESESTERPARPLSWDANTRAKLRQEAEAANTAIELQPCQRVSDYVLRYGAAK